MITLYKPDELGTRSLEIRAALSAVLANLSLGLLPFCLIIFSIRPTSLPVGIACMLCGTLYHCLSRTSTIRAPVAHRTLSCLLLGASFAVIPWVHGKLPFPVFVMAFCFVLRWLIFAMETWEIERADRMKQPLPSLSARIRRSITWITGALIPLLIWRGLSPIPLLSVSFLLTFLCQWIANIEMRLDLTQARNDGGDKACPAQ